MDGAVRHIALLLSFVNGFNNLLIPFSNLHSVFCQSRQTISVLNPKMLMTDKIFHSLLNSKIIQKIKTNVHLINMHSIVI